MQLRKFECCGGAMMGAVPGNVPYITDLTAETSFCLYPSLDDKGYQKAIVLTFVWYVNLVAK